MATYKVIQDIEAEDKLIGPLTLRQFIYAAVSAILAYLTYFVISKGLWFMATIFVPFAMIFAFFAWPWSRDQPTEIWALAKIRFLVKPRRRVWDQSGIKELVNITVPKKIERDLTKGLSETEVTSRLRALADTIDSRGWATKNVNVNLFNQSSFLATTNSPDRLINIASLPQTVPIIDIRAADDMLDEQNNPLAQQMQSRLAAADQAHHQQLIEEMKTEEPSIPEPPKPTPKIAAPRQNDYWFLNQPSQAMTSVPQNLVTFNTQLVAPGTPPSNTPVVNAANPTADEEQLLQELARQEHEQVDTNAHLHTIQPLSATHHTAAAKHVKETPKHSAKTAAPKVTRGVDTDILELAGNDDRTVASIAREIHKRREPPADEIVIPLR